MEKGLIIVLCSFFFCFATHAQQTNKNWMQDLNRDLEQFRACDNVVTAGINPCNKFIGSALSTVYKVNDFYSKELGRHLLVSEIASYLKENQKWSLLGKGFEQTALVQAQELANAGKAVVAIYLNQEGIGHVSIILPGELKPSGTWGFQVPNSASFFISTPDKSYVGKGLSYAFERPLLNGVLLYARNY
ncbi:hypothetical protein [Cesiribacter sp. SM1]|uniref:hypothetical protein n=1 Tax=Cesiribacter sp. SM1 TaxID=2861196 RepID=UPI001CD396F0|nr:hypothetical protein [Cesiribacter sp. SM1]